MKQLICGALPLVLLTVVACGGSNGTMVPSSSTSEQAAASGLSKQAGMARAASAVRSFRATFTVELLPSMAMEQGTLDHVLPDRSHVTITLSGGAMTNEMIIIGNDRYTRMGQSWVKIPVPGGLPRILTSTGGLNQLDAFRTAAEMGALNEGGSDTVNNKPCQIYSHSTGANSFEYCVADNLPLRMKVTMGTTAIIMFLFTDYNQVIDIDAPV